jgi:hypothetical protein
MKGSVSSLARQGVCMGYKKLLFLAAVMLTLIFPDNVFMGLAVFFLFILFLIILIELAFDIYILMALFIQWLRKSKQ